VIVFINTCAGSEERRQTLRQRGFSEAKGSLDAIGLELAFYKRSNELTRATWMAESVSRRPKGHDNPQPEGENETRPKRGFGQPD